MTHVLPHQHHTHWPISGHAYLYSSMHPLVPGRAGGKLPSHQLTLLSDEDWAIPHIPNNFRNMLGQSAQA